MRLGICGRLRPGLRGRGEPLPSGPAGRLPIFARWRGRVGIGGPLPRAGLGGFAAAPVRAYGPPAGFCGGIPPHPLCGGAPPPEPPGELFLWRKSSQKASQGRALGNPRRRRTSRYAEHRRHGNAAVAQGRSAPTHANVRLSPNGRAGVFIRVRQAGILLLLRCREESRDHQGPMPG